MAGVEIVVVIISNTMVSIAILRILCIDNVNIVQNNGQEEPSILSRLGPPVPQAPVMMAMPYQHPYVTGGDRGVGMVYPMQYPMQMMPVPMLYGRGGGMYRGRGFTHPNYSRPHYQPPQPVAGQPPAPPQHPQDQAQDQPQDPDEEIAAATQSAVLRGPVKKVIPKSVSGRGRGRGRGRGHLIYGNQSLILNPDHPAIKKKSEMQVESAPPSTEPASS